MKTLLIDVHCTVGLANGQILLTAKHEDGTWGLYDPIEGEWVPEAPQHFATSEDCFVYICTLAAQVEAEDAAQAGERLS